MRNFSSKIDSMRYYILILLLPFLAVACMSKPDNSDSLSFHTRDVEILDNTIDKFAEEKIPISDLMMTIGKSFLGTPYVAHTLEINETEMLVVNLHEFDCNTFIDNCLAICNTIRNENPGFDTFTNELTAIRYRNKKITDYTSRLHYFSDWIYENHQKGFVEDITSQISASVLANEVNFMSTHPNSYKQLKNNPALIPLIKQQEQEINQRVKYYIPKENISSIEEQLMNGDIIGITTNIFGLDIMHVGMIVKKDGRVYMMHASSDKKKVVITEKTLVEYLNSLSRATGIMVARPK